MVVDQSWIGVCDHNLLLDDGDVQPLDSISVFIVRNDIDEWSRWLGRVGVLHILNNEDVCLLGFSNRDVSDCQNLAGDLSFKDIDDFYSVVGPRHRLDF